MIPIHKEDWLAPVATLRTVVRKPRNHDRCESPHTHPRTILLRRGIGIVSPISLFPMGNRYHVPLFRPIPGCHRFLPLLAGHHAERRLGN